MSDDITRYRRFFESHDLNGLPKRSPAPTTSDDLQAHANEIIAYAQILKSDGTLMYRQSRYVENILIAACKILMAVRAKDTITG
jgi:hypothetical protein